MRYFALATDGYLYDLCDCGDIEAAEESANDILPQGFTAIWLADENTARQWADRVYTSLNLDINRGK